MSSVPYETIAQLRETIEKIEGRGQVAHRSLPFGIDALDARLAGGGLRIDALHEIAPHGSAWGDDAPATLFITGIAARTAGPILWLVRSHDLFAPGLYQAGLDPARVIHAEARDDDELLAMMEDALRHRGLGAVIGEAKKVALPATRRLQLAAEGGPTLALLLRRPARLNDDPLNIPSAATTRWRIAPAPSAPLPVEGIGRARWRAAVVRQRGGEPFEIIMEAPDETGRCALAAELVDRPDLASGADISAVA